ncbi:hypothetical protein DPEC_G00304720 [Dallia pectoralis]|uniref:Uncharacterized protein n=1 Tax=Dallia pectoralis TaxID=75939 RepID=A0ACC2FDN7_DALPE|nr:hypothetical protein DPEC_G00304720 [Dallia pectoralis]
MLRLPAFHTLERPADLWESRHLGSGHHQLKHPSPDPSMTLPSVDSWIRASDMNYRGQAHDSVKKPVIVSEEANK